MAIPLLNPDGQFDAKGKFDCDAKDKQRAKNFIIKLNEVIYALKADTSF